jgi:hypothetical protein
MTKRYTHATDERKRKAVAALGQKRKAGRVVTILVTKANAAGRMTCRKT